MVGGIELIHRQTSLKEDTAIGLLFVGMMALGVAVISKSRSYTGSLTSILFGDIFGVDEPALGGGRQPAGRVGGRVGGPLRSGLGERLGECVLGQIGTPRRADQPAQQAAPFVAVNLAEDVAGH